MSKHAPEIWAMARVIWENSNITYRELSETLKSTYGEKAPNSSAVCKKANAEKWSRKEPNKTPCTVDNETGRMIANTQQKIQHEMQKVEANAKEKAQIIANNKKSLKRLRNFFDIVMDKAEAVADIDPKESPDDARIGIVVAKELSNILSNASAVQKAIAEQEFVFYQITPEDFGQSEADKRMASMALMGDIEEEQRQIRQAKMPELIERLKNIESMSVDDIDDLGDLSDDDDD